MPFVSSCVKVTFFVHFQGIVSYIVVLVTLTFCWLVTLTMELIVIPTVAHA